MQRMVSKKVDFPGCDDIQLSGLVSYPETDEPLKGWFLFAHCFTCHKNYKVIASISRVLNAQGFGVFRFDFGGLGESGGRFEDTNLSTNIEDLQCAARFMAAEFQAPDLLIGHSFGGSAVLSASRDLASVQGVVTLATSFDPGRLQRLFTDVRDAMDAAPDEVFEVTVSGRKMPFKAQFLEDLAQHDLETSIRNLGKPLLILHSPTDRTTPIENAERIFEAASYPKSFLALDGASHLLAEKDAANYAGRMIAAWGERCLERSSDRTA